MRILITGGASGLGEAITRNLAKDPKHTVYFTFHKAGESAQDIEKEFPNAKGIACDFSSAASLQQLVLKIESLQLDVLINNAFTGLQTQYFHKTDPAFFVENFQKNIMPVISLTQQALLHFRKQKSGKIITVLSSYILNKPPVGLSEYVAEKNYLLSLSKSWAVENAKFNITSNCISPAMMLTNLTAGTDERIIEEMLNQHPLKKMLAPAEVAETVNYLVHASAQINGANIVINAASDLI
jgi:3-oxoacyl-[acyl-carrier protein] reductase